VAGAAALYLANHPDAAPAQVCAALVSLAEDGRKRPGSPMGNRRANTWATATTAG
jgi:hypothetical protein